MRSAEPRLLRAHGSLGHRLSSVSEGCHLVEGPSVGGRLAAWPPQTCTQGAVANPGRGWARSPGRRTFFYSPRGQHVAAWTDGQVDVGSAREVLCGEPEGGVRKKESLTKAG